MASSQNLSYQENLPYSDVVSDNRHVLAGQWHVGATLRAAREAGGESLDDVADSIRVRAEYLFAIEEENYYGLPGWAHAVGYVRSYALYLGLDSGPMVKRVRDQLALREHVFEQRAVDRSRSFSKMMVMACAAVVVATIGAGFWFSGSADGIAAIIRPVPERLMAILDDSLSRFTSTAKTTTAASKSDAIVGAVGKSDAQPLRNLTMTPVVSAGKSSGTLAGPGGPEAGTLVVRPLPRHSIDRGAVSMGQLTLRALQTVWFRVEDASGRVVTEREMGQGEVQKLSNIAGLVIAAQNGGALEYYVDGVRAGVLSSDGQSVSGLSLARLATQNTGG